MAVKAPPPPASLPMMRKVDTRVEEGRRGEGGSSWERIVRRLEGEGGRKPHGLEVGIKESR